MSAERHAASLALALGLLAPSLLTACRSSTSPAVAAATVPTAAVSSSSRPGGTRQVVWTAAPLKERSPDPISWAHGEQRHLYRGVDLSRLCEAEIALRSSVDPTRASWDRLVLVRGVDGHRAIFSAAELRPGWGPTRAWLCDEQDGAPLPAGVGPYRLIVPSDGGGARCVRQVVEVAVIDVSPLL